MTTVHDETTIYAEVRRLYLIDALSDPKAAERYMHAIEDVDTALLYIQAHPNAWQTVDAATEKCVLETLNKLTEEGLAFSKSKKERDAKS
jgi:hypothetical protein